MLYQSLKEFSKNIFIYTFNNGQFELLKENLKKESKTNIILLNENCENFKSADYIIINYIDSPISKESKDKFPNFKPDLNSRNFYNHKFHNDILEKYTKKMLYIVCNDEYLESPVQIHDNNINNLLINDKLNIHNGNKYKEIQVPKINRNYISNEYYICFIIDNTGSMISWINAIKNICNELFIDIVKQFKQYKFFFGCVLYADKLSCSSDENFKVSFTQNQDEFKSQLEEIDGQNGDDVAEDWVSGFQMALDELDWGNGTKLIFHIADAPHHGKTFNTDNINDNYLQDKDDINGKNLIKLIKRLSDRNIKITGISINKVCSFKVFQEEYKKVNGPKYEIIEVRNIIGDDKIKNKVLEIITKSVNENKASNCL